MIFYTSDGIIWIILAVLICVFWVSIRIIHIIALIYGGYKLHKRKKIIHCPENSTPGVTILKPLHGSSICDPNLYANLDTFFTLEYPKYEIIFCIQDRNPQLDLIVENLRGKYPNISSDVVYTGRISVGQNPKINNLYPGYKQAKYDYILISDSKIRMRYDTLSDMVSHMTETVGLVHQMPFTTDCPGYSGTLNKIYFGTSQARMYLTANLIGMNCVTGMSILIKKYLLDDLGGIENFGKYLAEDYFIAQAIQNKGYSTVICSQPALQNAGNGSIEQYHDRISRWIQLRTAMMPFMTLLEPLTECFLLGLLTAWAVFYLFHWDPISFLLIHFLIWFIMDWMLIQIIQNNQSGRGCNKFEYLVMWAYREITVPWTFVKAQSNGPVQWGQKSFKLKWGGLVEPLPQIVKSTVNSNIRRTSHHRKTFSI